ncbi:hydrogenase expression/formation C-terminal domain-containing protein [Escherichia coli]|uniref:hydrogenase expression/formation C-terminal domain-containing protein n=1 Tax=Escherichia coli TaxID=562 RepID=UPI000B7EEEB3|nr:hydrogenase expression/formation C-terminal domain-containing protein [Escherichia coli]EET7734897.1 hydrogenase expression/formation protein [Escherichia coli]EKE5038050.1 hydrogenase-1 operon protein HyaF2 [Escherichia coli]MBB9971748.1 hydrogenase-1 operon protein HyaF2 [Escherichia coli]NJX03809.1 hydrogenase expression/formation protein [Escherichia coli]TZB22638.1 hydrogenase-1 operon protein HyaF2 [Escherichia coli]
MKSELIKIKNIYSDEYSEKNDFDYMVFPSLMKRERCNSYDSVSKKEISIAKKVFSFFSKNMKNSRGLVYPLCYELSQEEQQYTSFLDSILGEGEISARSKTYKEEEEIQETIYTGVWRVKKFDVQKKLISDKVLVDLIPESLVLFRGESDITLPPEPEGIMNAGFVAREIKSRLQHIPDEKHIINLTLLPFNNIDHEYINDFLGEGSCAIFSRGYGKCRIVSSKYSGVWRINYFNDMNTKLQDLIEISSVPDIAMAGVDDLEHSYDEINETLKWINSYE